MTEEARKADRPGNREFAFSRVAGVSPTEYAAVSSTAVAALVVSLFSWLGLLAVWGLLAPVLAILLAVLSIYYISTSAGTLAGRKVALTAVAISLAVGGFAGVRQLSAYRQRQADAAHVRGLAEAFRQRLAAGDYQAIYDQLGLDYRAAISPGQWRYEWASFFERHGRPEKMELSPRAVFLPNNQIVLTINVHVDPARRTRSPRWDDGSVVPIHLLYARPIDQKDPDGPRRRHPTLASPLGPSDWQLLNLPGFIESSPLPYVEALVWPAPGPVHRVTQTPGGYVVIQRIEPGRRRWSLMPEPPAPWLAIHKPRPMAPSPDAPPAELAVDLAEEPLVPPEIFWSAWLPVRAQPAPQAHRHRH